MSRWTGGSWTWSILPETGWILTSWRPSGPEELQPSAAFPHSERCTSKVEGYPTLLLQLGGGSAVTNITLLKPQNKTKVTKKATHLNPNVFKVTGCSSWCDQTGQILLVFVDVVIFTLFFSVGKTHRRLHGSKIQDQRSHLSHMVLIDVAACLLQPQQWMLQHRHAANVEPDLCKKSLKSDNSF